MAPAAVVLDFFDLQVAGLILRLDAQNAGFSFSPPACHLKFIKALAKGDTTVNMPNVLYVKVQRQTLPVERTWGGLLCRTKIWELWQDSAGMYTFITPRGMPPCRFSIDAGYTSGDLFWDIPAENGDSLYPLTRLDIIVFANWLGGFGDMILHASGVVVDGKGYAFAGRSGAGKSTLAASLRGKHAVTVLGEDQVILRYLDGRFMIHGTPWHQNPDLCSPLGAPLEKIFYLDRQAPEGTLRYKGLEGATRLLQTAFIPYYRPDLLPGILDHLNLLAARVPFYSLNYRLGSDAWPLIQAA